MAVVRDDPVNPLIDVLINELNLVANFFVGFQIPMPNSNIGKIENPKHFSNLSCAKAFLNMPVLLKYSYQIA